MNLTFDIGTDWHYSPTGDISDGDTDLYRVALHEIGHALKSYVSQLGLVEGEYSQRWYRPLNTNWLVHSIGIGLKYRLQSCPSNSKK